jgi:dTDP-4-dehydrorhamnose 3,5-epimerase
MKFIESPLAGAYIIEIDKHADDRGFFARTYCQNLFREIGIQDTFVQSNISFNLKKGTLRGMHFQAEPHAESKIVSCFTGEIYDVIIDLRTSSDTYCEWFGIFLNDRDNKSLYIPRGFAHGFQTMQDSCLVHYQMGSFYNPEYARGIRWNDSCFKISWPRAVTSVSVKDESYPDFKKK